MSKQKKQVSAKHIAKIAAKPTLYPYALDDLKGADYADTLEMLFHEKDWQERMARRNRIYHGIDRMPEQNRPSAVRALEDADRWFANRLLQALVLRSVQVTTREHQTMDVYYKELPADAETMEKRDRLARMLDATVFLMDIIESKITDINDLMRSLFNDNTMVFEQMDGVLAALRQMHDFFGATRDKGSMEEQNLFADYAESIENDMDGRMKTYVERAKKLREKQNKV